MRQWFLNLRTGIKLGIAFGAAFLIAILVGLAGRETINRLFVEADRASFLAGRGINSLVRLRFTADAVLAGLSQRSLGGAQDAGRDPDRPLTAEERKGLEEAVARLAEQARSLLSEKERIIQTAQSETEGVGLPTTAKDDADEAEKESRQTLANIAASLKGFEDRIALLQGMVTPPEKGSEAAPKPLLVKEVAAPLVEVVQDARRLEGALATLSTKATTRMARIREVGTEVTVYGALAGALLALLVAVITTRMVVRPLTEMTSAAHRISEGDLAAEINHVSRDEVGGLADSFRRMQGSLRDLSAEAQRVAAGDLTRTVRGGGELAESFSRMVESLSALLREIQEAGTQVRGNSSKILAGLQHNAEASREEATAADRVQASMEKLSESARAIASSSADVERTAGDAARVASHGTAQVGEALEGLFRTRERVNEIAQKTMILGEKCRRIGEVLKIIRDVAGEIHMLALNAAIESAASAGEHGKRFTVVAGEVRRLAERTRQSAEEIRSILTEIQQAAEATVAAAQEGAKQVEAGSTVATGARAALEEVIGRIHQTAEVAREISRATQDQRQASEQVAGSMRDISRAVRRMAEGSEESTNAVRELTALAERFGDLMGTFRTG
jgi:methyl-accepting chemotaxis protein